VKTFTLSSARSSEFEVEGLELCTVHWVVLRASTCTNQVQSEPFKLALTNVRQFDLALNLEKTETCASFEKSVQKISVGDFESVLMGALVSSGCGGYTVDCFINSSFSCFESNPNQVHIRYIYIFISYNK